MPKVGYKANKMNYCLLIIPIAIVSLLFWLIGKKLGNFDKKIKIYISGKISGIEDSAYDIFEKAEIFLIKSGYKVVNPMKLPHDHDKSWESYMKEDLKALMDCDEIFMLENWETSRGAEIEYDLASELGIKISYQII